MNLLNSILNYKENISNVKNFFINISKEMITALWVVIVLLLIIWSYIENEMNVVDSFETDVYQISITDILE